MKVANPKSIIFKVALMSLMPLCGIAAIVSTAIPLMAETLTKVSLTQVEMLASIPNFGILLFVFLSPWMTRKFGDKKVAIVGMLIVLITGVTPSFTNNYSLILVTRFLLGCGVGMFNSQAYSLIAIYYNGDERTKILGYANAFSAVCSTILTFLVGVLLNKGWHAAYWIYFFAIIPLMLFSIFIPETPKELLKNNTVSEGDGQKATLFWPVVKYSIYSFIIYACYMTSVYKISTLVIEKGYGTASEVGYVSSIGGALGFIGGLLFIYVFRIFKKNLLPVCLIGICLCFVGLSYSNSLIITGAILVISGIFFGWASTSLFNSVAQSSDAVSQNLSSSVLLVGINLGCFANPVIVNLIGKMIGTEKTANLILMVGLILGVCGMLNLVVTSFANKKIKAI